MTAIGHSQHWHGHGYRNYGWRGHGRYWRGQLVRLWRRLVLAAGAGRLGLDLQLDF